MRQLSAPAFVMAIVPVLAAAQQFLPAVPGLPVDPDIRFEVVSLKAGEAGGETFFRMTPGRIEARNLPVGILLRQALQKPDYQTSGTPGWAGTERYSIAAKAPDDTPPGSLNVLLLNLLKDRFQLTTHLETRDLPIFNLVMARTDGRPGPDLKPTSAECQAVIAERLAAFKAAAPGSPPPQPASFPGPNDPLPCGFMSIPPGRAAASGRPIAQLIPTLGDLVGRPVVDKTGLPGLYDFTLTYAPTGRAAGPFGALPGAPEPIVNPDVPSLFTALQEQLGLKLEPGRGPVEVVVIDRFEKPTLD
jgi:uncharacterized protein (TIGR03435 family)